MSFLEHLDELRRRLVNSVIIVFIAFAVCFYFSDTIFGFLSVPIRRALSEAERQDVPLRGLTGGEKILALSELKEGDRGVYVFDKPTRLGSSIIAPGTSVSAIVARDAEGAMGVFTEESIVTNSAAVPSGVRLPIEVGADAAPRPVQEEELIVTTAAESFTLLVTVSLYSAIALSVPFLLLQVWGFISPALYKHERAYVTPFILLSSTSFVLGAAFAYYILFPPALSYLLSLGEDFRLLLRATDYFDFITLIMLAMGVIFQMPAVTYVLSRIGLISAGLLFRSWKLALVIILIVAALVSPTGDIPNMLLFATPMIVLYVFSIGIAWLFGKRRQPNIAAD